LVSGDAHASGMASSRAPVKVVVVGRKKLRRAVADALAASGIEVTECGSRVEALAAVEQTHPDVCVVDRETGGGGLIATAALSSPATRPKVLVIGGGPARAERRAAGLAGAAEYLPGAPDTERLVAAVVALAATGSQKRTEGNR
jgi:DNA-binding NarL/FixJ family response regulator